MWYVGQKKKGIGHQKNNEPCQDAYKIHIKNGESILVVSDGLGSKKMSHIGSKEACNAAVWSWRKSLKKKHFSAKRYIKGLLDHWHENLPESDPKEYSCTCLIWLTHRGKGIALRLGDGMISVLDQQGKANTINESKDDSFLNVTDTLPQGHKIELWQIEYFNLEHVRSVFLATDGASEDLKADLMDKFMIHFEQEYQNLSQLNRNIKLQKELKNWSNPHQLDDQTLVFCKFNDSKEP